MRKMITGECDICKRQFQAIHDRAMKKTIGSHKRFAHGIKGLTGRERYYVYSKGWTVEQARAHIASKVQGMSAKGGGREYVGIDPSPESSEKLIDYAFGKALEQAARKKACQQAYRKAHRKQTPQQQNGSDAVPAKLSECPCCGARFWITKGQ